MSYRKQTEAAFKSYFAGKVGVPVYAGTSDTIKAMPCVVVAYLGGTQNPPHVGNLDVTMSVSIQSEIDEEGQPNALEVHDELLSAIEDALFEPAILDINSATDFHLFGVTEHSGIERDTEGTILRETITITAPCALGNF